MSTTQFATHEIVRLFGKVDRDSVTEVIDAIISSNLRRDQPFVRLWINSPGGDVVQGFALLDIMRWSRVPIHTTGLGMVGSMALLILMAGARGHRCVLPRTMLLSHRFSAHTAGSHADLMAERVLQDRLHDQIVDHYTHCTGQDAATVTTDLLRPTDRWLNPDEAVAAGLIDHQWIAGTPTAECA